MDLISLIGTASSLLNPTDPYKDWEAWDNLDISQGKTSGGQAKWHIKTMPTKSASSIARTMPNLNSWIKSKGLEQAFRLWRDFPDNDKLTPQEIYAAFKVGGQESAGIELSNAYAAFLKSKDQPLSLSNFTNQTGGVMGGIIGGGNVGSGNVGGGGRNVPNIPTAKKTNWVLPTVIGVSALAIIGTIIYFKTKK